MNSCCSLENCLISDKVANMDYFSLGNEEEGNNAWELPVRSKLLSLNRVESPH